jgi:hypothetical protein
MRKFLILSFLLMPSLGYSDYVCGVRFEPARNNPTYGNIGYVTVHSSASSNCTSQTTSYILATGTTTCSGYTPDSGSLYPEASLMDLLTNLNNAKQNGRSVSYWYGNNTANCQITAVLFN